MDKETGCHPTEMGTSSNTTGKKLSNSIDEMANTQVDKSVGNVSQKLTEIKNDTSKPTCIVVLGVADSGKTTFVQKMVAHLHEKKMLPYVINLDPACVEVPYPVNVDIRDTIKYQEIKKQRSLDPNDAIKTSLNLYAAEFEKVVGCIGKQSSDYKYVIFDTPCQIELFSRSATGMIITEVLSSTYPSVVVYVMDVIHNVKPEAFMSNMLYARDILYKTKLPFVIAMNKMDVVNQSFATEWMNNFTVIDEQLDAQTSYASNSTTALSLVLSEFYADLKIFGVSALKGQGMDDMCKAIDEATVKYLEEYKPVHDKLRQEKEAAEKQEKKQEMKDFGGDIDSDD